MKVGLQLNGSGVLVCGRWGWGAGIRLRWGGRWALEDEVSSQPSLVAGVDPKKWKEMVGMA